MRFIVACALIVLAIPCHAQTKAERIRHIRELVAIQKKDLDDARGRLTWTWNELEIAKGQIDQIVRERDGAQAEANKMRPIVEQVNRWWGIGGVLYGFGRLAQHLLILLAVLVAIAIGLLVASFFIPFLAPVLTFTMSIWKRILSLFHKQT